MKGDFTRFTYRAGRHYSGVRLQQGRVQLDADWNEQVDIQTHRDETTAGDLIGHHGAPMQGGGFRIAATFYPRSIFFLDAARGWAVGDDATLVATADGGTTWTVQAPPAGVAAHLRGVCFADQNHGWAVGDGGTILATANGGAAWAKQAPPAGTAPRLRSVHFVSANQGWAVGDGATILTTANGGAKWDAQTAPAGVTAHLRGVYFVSPTSGWAVGDDGTILATANGGANWVKQAAPTGVAAHLYGVCFISDKQGWAVGDGGTVLATKDGGKEWKQQSAGAAKVRLMGVHFTDKDHGWAAGEEGTLLITTDGGATWSSTRPGGVAVDLRTVRFVSAAQGWLAGDEGTILRTTNGGAGWARLAAPAARSLSISAGRMYVEGVLCENDENVPFTAQPDLPGAVLPAGAGRYLAYLDVWQRHLTALERPELREVALGGPDTATRTQTVWQVKLDGPIYPPPVCGQYPAGWEPEATASTGRLRAQAAPGSAEANECSVAAGAGYRRLENQLYRVEIHAQGKPGAATFKWSRDNASLVARREGINGVEITVSDPGKDPVTGFEGAKWIELSDDECVLAGKTSLLLEVASVKDSVITVKTAPDPALVAGPQPTVRRWDGTATVEMGKFLGLEDGVEVEFAAGDYRTGDYWLIPARTLTGSVEWPRDSAGPHFEARHGIEHCYCPLALVDLGAAGWSVQSDCRKLFPAVTDLTGFFHLSGDGQEALPGEVLPGTLRAGVANGRWPVAGARVRFSVMAGGGALTYGNVTAIVVEIPTNALGVAECQWRLGSNPADRSQQVEAILLNDLGQPVHLPLRFNATLSLASQVAYDPRNCSRLAGRTTVQAAIDGLCSAGQLEVQDECGPPMLTGRLNFTGAGVTAFQGKDRVDVAIPGVCAEGDDPTYLLFPFVTSQAGWETGIAIANTSKRPPELGSQEGSGTCTMYFYGTSAPAAVNSPVIVAGSVWASLASAIAPGFLGYVIVLCRFPKAYGYAQISDAGARTFATSYLAVILPEAPACAEFPKDYVPFTKIHYVIGPDSLGDGLVVGEMSQDAFKILRERVPLPSAYRQRFCGEVKFAEGWLAQAFVPTQAERNGDFNAFELPLLDPTAAGQPFPKNAIPGGRIPQTFAWRVSSVRQVR